MKESLYAATLRGLRSLGDNVSASREAHGLSMRAAAEEIGCSVSTVHAIEHGKIPDGKTILAVLSWLERRWQAGLVPLRDAGLL